MSTTSQATGSLVNQEDLLAIYLPRMRQRFKTEVNRLTGGAMRQLLKGHADADDLAHAGHVQYPGVIERCQPAIECGACLDRGIEHAWQPQVCAVNLLAGEFVGGIQALDRLARALSARSPGTGHGAVW